MSINNVQKQSCITNETSNNTEYYKIPSITENEKNGIVNVTYYNGKQWEHTSFRKTSNVVSVFVEMRNVLLQKGNGIINEAQANSILQKVFEQGSTDQHGGRTLYRQTQLSTIKDLFELYMDRCSDGGEDITQREQFAIMRTLDQWEGVYGKGAYYSEYKNR